MDLIKKAKELIIYTPITAIRYLMLIVGVFVLVTNIFDAILLHATIRNYILDIGLISVLILLLVFISNDMIVLVVMSLIGFFIIFDKENVDSLSGGMGAYMVCFLLSDNKGFAAYLYISAIMAILANHTFNKAMPIDSINVIIVHVFFFIIIQIIRHKLVRDSRG